MSGQHAADAEFDEALALVNGDRARAAGPGAAQPDHPDHPDHPGHPGHPEAADVPDADSRTPGPQHPGPGAHANTPGDPFPAPGVHANTPGDPFPAPGVHANTPGDPFPAPGVHANTPGVHANSPGDRRTTPAGQPTAPHGQAHTPGDRPSTGSPQAPTSPPRPRATPWPEARAIARRAGAASATAAATAPPPTGASIPAPTDTTPTPGTPTPATSPLALPLPQTLGRTLTTALTALTDLPSFDTSAMDGWAVAGPGPWAVLAEGVLAGHGSPEPLGDGEAVRIATGARIPRDTTAVIRSEHGHVDGKGRLHAQREVVPGQDIRPRGQECRAGERLLPPGTLVTPAVLGLAAAAGYDVLCVAARPRVEVLVLGDELLTEGLPQDGLIRDALGPMLPPWLRALGAEVTAVRRLGDDAEALYEALATATADVVVTTGGTASGPVDHVHPTLRRLGAELLVDGVAVRPGHPMLLARLPGGTADTRTGAPAGTRAHPTGAPASTRAPARPRHLVGLPGNPLAAVSGLLTLAEPLLRGLANRPAPEPYAAPLREDVHGHPHDTRLVPVTLRGEYAVPLHYNGPAMLRGIAVADGLAVVPPGGARRGQELEILDLPWTEPGGLPGELGMTGPDGEVCFT
ncbi:molybdopterin molybdotransferase MoeA [Streptomyces flavofungini]|uniref:molybdopterin molybdotransferase MoeA n=1 Tax=Streptomyces flavofungini TaxID=68200 RepID=UPI0019C70F43|nr:molybdopterin molybdotransferase MoeA [Streptomyces flavofungini]GHC75634.1 hypothetical protein GCM10010349_54890 [Streptomyces flavofungini]